MLFLAPAFLQAQDNFTLRSKVKVTKELGKSYMALQFEHRTKECLFVRLLWGVSLHLGMHKARTGDFPIGHGYFMNDYIMVMDL